MARNWVHVSIFDDERFISLLNDCKVAVITFHKEEDLSKCGLFRRLTHFINIPPQPFVGLGGHGGELMWTSLFDGVMVEIPSMVADIIICAAAGVWDKFFCERSREYNKVGLDFGTELDKRLGFKTR